MKRRRILFDGSQRDYETLKRKLSHQGLPKPIIRVTTIHYKNTQQTMTKARETDRDLASILDPTLFGQVPDTTKVVLYVDGRTLKLDVDTATTFETERFYVMATEISEKYHARFMSQLNDDDLTLHDKQELLGRHCSDISSHVIRALGKTKMPSLLWERTRDDTWQLVLGILHGTLVRHIDDEYTLYVTSRDKCVLLTKTVNVQSEEPLEDVQKRCVDIMSGLFETYRTRMTLTKDAIAYQRHHDIREYYPLGTIYRDDEKSNELDILRHKLATMYHPIERTESDHYNWLMTDRTDRRQELRDKLKASGTFDMLVIGSRSNRDRYGTNYDAVCTVIPKATLADVIPKDTGSDGWLISLEHDGLYVETRHLHGTSEYEYRKLKPDVEPDDERLELLQAMMASPSSNFSTTQVMGLVHKLSEPLGPMYEALENQEKRA